MNSKIRYSGIAAITFSLFMLSLGSMPTSDAGVVGSTLSVTLSCGLALSSATINWDNTLNPTLGNTLDSTNAGDYTGPQPAVSNPGGNTADSIILANVGAVPTGGYAGTTDLTTHIQPQEITMDLLLNSPPAGPVTMANGGGDTAIGTLIPGESQTLQLVVDSSNIVGQPISDATWAAQIDLTAVCQFN